MERGFPGPAQRGFEVVTSPRGLEVNTSPRQALRSSAARIRALASRQQRHHRQTGYEQSGYCYSVNTLTDGCAKIIADVVAGVADVGDLGL